MQSLEHYGQIINSKQFKLFDWGPQTNLIKYGQKTPPKIEVDKITEVPIAMFVGLQDSLGDDIDNRWLKDELESAGSALVHYQQIDAGHASFMVGKDMTYFE